MSLFNSLQLWAAQKIGAQILRQTENTYQRINQGTVTWQGVDASKQVEDGYNGNDIVYSCIKLIADKAKLAPWYEYKVVDKKAYKEYRQKTAQPDKVTDWKQVKELHTKALELVGKQTKISDLLIYPNADDTWGDLIEAAVSYKLITGNDYIYGKTITAGVNKGLPNSLHVLPAQYMQIMTNMAAFPVEAVGYALMIGKIVNFTRSEILHDKFFNPDWDANGMQLYGLSPLQAAAKVLTRSNQGKEYAVSAYQNGGPPGVLFVKKDQGFNGVDLTAQVDLVKERLRQYEGSKNANKIPVSGFEIGYQQIGLSPVDMDILDAEIFDMRAICNIYGVPSQLLNDPDNKTYNNQAEGEKALTTRCALPLLTALRDNFNRKLKNDWNAGSDTVIDFDLSVYSELEGNKLEQVNWLEKSLLPLYRRYEILGESVPEWMDEATRNTILVPSGYQPLEETLMPVPDLQNPYNATP